jgi:steroid delta-isomerase-like uncharacterized protein
MQHQSLLEEILDAYNTHDVPRIVAIYHPDYFGSLVSEGAGISGLTDLHEKLTRLFLAFPDLQLAVEETVSEENRIAIAWIASGTQLGKIMNIPSTKKRLQLKGQTILEIRDGKVARTRHLWDLASMLRQMGLLPELHPQGIL